MNTSGNGDLELEVVNDDSQLVMDLFFPNIIRGRDAGDISGDELLDLIKEVDGEGSGLDADTLDGKDASDFLSIGDLPAGEVVVGSEDCGVAGGGGFSDFENAFNDNFKVEL